MRKRADKAYKRGFLFSYMHMGAVQGRVPVFVALYTCICVRASKGIDGISHISPSLPAAAKLTYPSVCQPALQRLSSPGFLS